MTQFDISRLEARTNLFLDLTQQPSEICIGFRHFIVAVNVTVFLGGVLCLFMGLVSNFFHFGLVMLSSLTGYLLKKTGWCSRPTVFPKDK